MIGFKRTGGLRYVSAQDPALDRERSDVDKYISTGDWDQYMRIREGMVPTVFHLRRLTRAQFQAVSGMAANLQQSAAVAYGVESVDNFQLATGQMLIVKHVGDGEDRRLDVDTLNAMFSADLFAELSLAILGASRLDPLGGPPSASSRT